MEDMPQLELGRPLSEGIRTVISQVIQTKPKTPLETLELALLKVMIANIMDDPNWKQEAQKNIDEILSSQNKDGSFTFNTQEDSQQSSTLIDTIQAAERLYLLSKFEDYAITPTVEALQFLISSSDNSLVQLSKAYISLINQNNSYPPPTEAINDLEIDDAIKVLTILYAASSNPTYLTEGQALLDKNTKETMQQLEIMVWKNSGYLVEFYPKDLHSRKKILQSLTSKTLMDLTGILGYIMGESHHGFAEISFSALGDFSPYIDDKLDPTLSVTKDTVMLGARGTVHQEIDGLLYLGRVTEHAPTDMYGYGIQMDASFPHVVLIAGMRGSGKSYTLGVFAEELARQDIGIGVIVIDPLGVFWSMKLPNSSRGERKLIENWNLVPKGHPDKVKVFIPIGYYDDYPAESKDAAFAIAPAEIEAGDWAFMFKIDLQAPMGLLLRQAINKIQKGYQSSQAGKTVYVAGKQENYSIRDIIQCISTDVDISSKDRGFAKTTRRALVSRFMQVETWGLFSSDHPTPLSEISKSGQVAIIDVSFISTVEPESVAMIVGLLSRRILQERIRIGRAEESALLTDTPLDINPEKNIPVTWMLIDEAHMLVPEGEKTAASQPLIEFAKQGRKPGCGLVLATQRPAATSDQVLSQVDLVMCHALVLEDDLRALLKRTPAKLPKEFKSADFIRTLPVGASIVADQKTPLRAFVCRTRPRTSSHAGSAAKPSKILSATPSTQQESLIFEKSMHPTSDEPIVPETDIASATGFEDNPSIAPSVDSPPSIHITDEPPRTSTDDSPPSDIPPAVLKGYLSRKLLYGYKQFFYTASQYRTSTETGLIYLQEDQWQPFQSQLLNAGWTLKSTMEEDNIVFHLLETSDGKLGIASIRKNGHLQTVWAYVGANSADIAFLTKYSPS